MRTYSPLHLACLILAILPLLLACNSSGNSDEGDEDDDFARRTTFILVRHAEKQGGSNPELTEAGVARAATLAERLRREKVVAVYSTGTKRTLATAGPTAAAHGLEIQQYDAGSLSQFAKELKQKHQGGTVLVVGHSNTTPALANYLSNSNEAPGISEDDFENIFRVKVRRNGKATFTRDSY